jgi:hypothetical protein
LIGCVARHGNPNGELLNTGIFSVIVAVAQISLRPLRPSVQSFFRVSCSSWPVRTPGSEEPQLWTSPVRDRAPKPNGLIYLLCLRNSKLAVGQPTSYRSSGLESQKPTAGSAPWFRFCIGIGRRNVPGKDIDWRPDRKNFVRRCSHRGSRA